MARTVAIGTQDFEDLREGEYFYIDKSYFIKEWWEAGDAVTVIMRPRRFGKTLNISMLECFFSDRYAGRGDLFQGLSIWQEERYRQMQGTFPVINLSFAAVKSRNYKGCYTQICKILEQTFAKHNYLLKSDKLDDDQKDSFREARQLLKKKGDEAETAFVLNTLSELLYVHTGKKPIILLDEYDTPMQEAYIRGFWEEIVDFVRNLFNATFKTNPSLRRAVMTGITRVSKESIFSDLNNLEVVSTTAKKYEIAFGFTQNEVLIF